MPSGLTFSQTHFMKLTVVGKGGQSEGSYAFRKTGQKQNSTTHTRKHNKHSENDREHERHAHRQIGQIIANRD